MKYRLFYKNIKFSFFKRTEIHLRSRDFSFYEVLGLEKGCTQEQIRKAYLRLAKQYHPDINKDPGSDEKFKSITLAYEALNSEVNRNLYDAYMDSDPYSQEWKYKEEMWEEDNRKDRSRYYDTKNSYYKYSTESGFWSNKKQYEEQVNKDFDNMFGSGYRQSKPQKGEDIKLEINISFSESMNGVNKVIIELYRGSEI